MSGPRFPWHLRVGRWRNGWEQAALGLSQLARLDDYVARRHAIAHRYSSLLVDLPVTIPWQHPDTYSALHLYVIRLQVDKIARSHREVFETMRERGIGVNLHFIPVHTQPYYQAMGFMPGGFPEAERYYSEAISLPMYPTLTTGQQDTVLDALKKGLNA